MKATLRVILEVILISTGVFLGLMGEQWREKIQHRGLAEDSIRRFRSEFATNRDAVVAVRDHHLTGLDKIEQYLSVDQKEREKLEMPFRGTHPAFLEYTAWDVAQATQALAYINLELAQSIAHVYAVQRQLDDTTRDITEVLYLKSGEENLTSFLISMAVYFGDCNLIEPRLLALYDDMIPRLDQVLAGSSE